MLNSLKRIDGYKVVARDAEVGTVREAYFDDANWVIRHLVVATGGWFSGRDVLISPHSISALNPEYERVDAALTRKQIEEAPGIDTDQPVSRQHEIPYYDYYGYPYYWAGAGLWGAAAYPLAGAGLAVPPRGAALPREVAERQAAEREQGDLHLRSSAEVIGYGVEASDGSIGHIEDFLFDPRSWAIRYAVVSTRNWLPGRHVLIAPDWIESVSWSERRARVELSRDAIKASPPYDRDAPPLSDADEATLHRHYGRRRGETLTPTLSRERQKG